LTKLFRLAGWQVKIAAVLTEPVAVGERLLPRIWHLNLLTVAQRRSPVATN
jgi:hypothetical protein